MTRTAPDRANCVRHRQEDAAQEEDLQQDHRQIRKEEQQGACHGPAAQQRVQQRHADDQVEGQEKLRQAAEDVP